MPVSAPDRPMISFISITTTIRFADMDGSVYACMLTSIDPHPLPMAGLARCGKSCRLRWTNYLRPDIKRGRFSFEEEETIIQLHSILGNK